MVCPLSTGHPDGSLVFDVVFVTMLVSLVALVVRGESTFVPDGDMVLTAHDVLLVAVAPDTAPATLVAWATDPPAD